MPGLKDAAPGAAPAGAVEVLDPRFADVAAGAGSLEHLCAGALWSEGPVWMHEDNSVLWSDIPNNRMLRWHAAKGMTVWRKHAEFSNGHTREADGSLLHGSHGLRAIVRTRFGPEMTPLADEIVVDRYQGRRLNSPNDVAVKSDGSIWFTDPPYGIVSDIEGHRAMSELGRHHVFRFDPANGALRSVSDFLEDPNGLAFSPDESVLYVSDTSRLRQDSLHAHHQIVAFDVIGGGDLANPRVFAVIEPGQPDGLRVDHHGFVYAACADGVQVFHADGTRVARIPVPEAVGNLSFGGADRDQLYICASTSLYRLRLNTRGVQRP